MLDSDGCQGLKCPGNPITRQHIISQDGPKGFQKFPGGLNRLSWVTAVAPTVKTIPPKPCPGISEIGVFRNCPDPEMLVSPEPSSKSQVSRVKHFPWDVGTLGGTPFLGTLGVRPSLGRWGYALPWDVGGTPFLGTLGVRPSGNLVVQSKFLGTLGVRPSCFRSQGGIR